MTSSELAMLLSFENWLIVPALTSNAYKDLLAPLVVGPASRYRNFESREKRGSDAYDAPATFTFVTVVGVLTFRTYAACALVPSFAMNTMYCPSGLTRY